jgi:Ion channel
VEWQLGIKGESGRAMKTGNGPTSVNHRIVVWMKRYRPELIAVAFVVQILASPLADRDPHVGAVLALLLLATFIVGTSYHVNRKVAYLALAPFCLVWLVARMLEAFAGPGHIYSHLAPAAGLGFSCAALCIIFHRFFSVNMVTRAMLAEAFVCYLIIAIAFSQLYLLLSRIADHPFNQEIPATQSSTFLYFSMDTLSGVGTGVIAPINAYIRLITGIENMIGIFYLAVVVSRLVSSYRPRDRQQHHQPVDEAIE